MAKKLHINLAGHSIKHMIYRNGNLRLHSRGSILGDIALTLSEYDLPAPLQKKVNIYVGVHKFKRRIMWPGLNIGIQTEQYLDTNGERLWRHHSKAEILRQVSQYRLVLDLSPANKPAYDFLPQTLRRQVIFGPDIFPDKNIDFQPAQNNTLVFFGALNQKRCRILEEMSKTHTVHTLKSGNLGAKLRKETRPCFGIINLHYDNGIYSEIPRLLSAYLHGKPVFSEKLAPPLVEGLHYFSLQAEIDETAARTVFERFRQEFVTRHRFSGFLEEIDRRFGVF